MMGRYTLWHDQVISEALTKKNYGALDLGDGDVLLPLQVCTQATVLIHTTLLPISHFLEIQDDEQIMGE